MSADEAVTDEARRVLRYLAAQASPEPSGYIAHRLSRPTGEVSIALTELRVRGLVETSTPDGALGIVRYEATERGRAVGRKREPARLTFPAEPQADGTRVRLDTDGHADGAVYERMAVETALPPKATRRWRPIAPPSMWATEAVALGTSYATWPALLVYALTGSRSRCEIVLVEGDAPTDM